MSQLLVPFAKPPIGEREIAAVERCLRSGWLTTGPETRLFEQEFANFLGVPHAIAVNSCTAGLHLALEAAGVGPGDRVITTPYTFTATAEVVRYLGAEIVLCDIDSSTLNLDVEALQVIAERVKPIKAIIPVHFAGLACSMPDICRLAAEHGWTIVEDAAHALPATDTGALVGSSGRLTAFSFYATKTLATGEGGMVVTDSDQLAQRMRTMRLHGINRDVFDRYTSTSPGWYYEVVAPGFKYNMMDLVAALGRVQLERVTEMRKQREHIAGIYTELLEDLPLTLPADSSAGETHAWHLFVVRLNGDDPAMSRDHVIESLARAGIGTSVHFIPLHLHPYWQQRYQFKPEDFPVSLASYRNAISLPIYPDMTDSQVELVADSLREVLQSAGS
jgi:dTDP-4-amino-4,6-dideoxygalactose transaminase